MAWVSTVPIGRGRRRGSADDTYVREYVQFFRVTFDTMENTEYDALNAPDLPSVSDPYDQDDDALCKKLTAIEQEDFSTWLIEVLYSSNASDPSLQNLDPLDEEPDISYDEEPYELALQYDLDGKQVINSASVPYSPPLVTEDVTVIVNININVSSFQLSDQQQYCFKYNLTPMWGQPAGRVLCFRFSGRRQFKNGIVYWVQSTQWKIMSDLQASVTGGSWANAQLLDVGMQALNASNVLQAMPEALGRSLPPGPYLLDGAGHFLLGDGAVPHYNTFTVKYGVDFGPLNLPDV